MAGLERQAKPYSLHRFILWDFIPGGFYLKVSQGPLEQLKIGPNDGGVKGVYYEGFAGRFLW